MQPLSTTLFSAATVILLLTEVSEASTTINCPATSFPIPSYVKAGWYVGLPYSFSLSQAEILQGSPNDTLNCRYAVSEGTHALHIYVQMGRAKPKNTCVLTTNKKGFKCN
jgi:hypothetical protein